jgi:hypothetical protein
MTARMASRHPETNGFECQANKMLDMLNQILKNNLKFVDKLEYFYYNITINTKNHLKEE